MRFMCEECPLDAKGFFINYCQDHQQSTCNHVRIKRYKWTGVIWEKTSQPRVSKNSYCDLCFGKTPRDKHQEIAMILKNSNDDSKEALFLCKEHYLEGEYEGYDTHEIKIHDKNINTYIAHSTRQSVQKYYSIEEFIKSFKKLKSNDFGNVVIMADIMKEIEFKFIKRTIYEKDKSTQYITFSKSIFEESNELEELRLLLNFKFQDYEFDPPIGLSISKELNCHECQHDKLESIYNLPICKKYRWVCLDEACTEYYSSLQNASSGFRKNKSLELCIIHKIMKLKTNTHTPDHKMIFVQVDNYSSTKIILNEKTDCDLTINKTIDYNNESTHLPFNFQETIICDICESIIKDFRWHCIDCYDERLGVDLCQNCWEHHNRAHHLAVFKHNDNSNNLIDRKWIYLNIFKILDVLKDSSYSCMFCDEKLTKNGLAVSFNVEIECLRRNRRKINSDFLLCLDDFNNFNCSKLESVYSNGSFSLVEWINQYDRRGWHEIITNISKNDLKYIISYIIIVSKKFIPCFQVCKTIKI